MRPVHIRGKHTGTATPAPPHLGTVTTGFKPEKEERETRKLLPHYIAARSGKRHLSISTLSKNHSSALLREGVHEAPATHGEHVYMHATPLII